MNKILRLITAAALAALAGCDDFSTSYERIDESEFRLLDFMYLPADASPGDTITLMAVFAGKKVDLDSCIDWWISFNVITDIFGEETIVDSVPLLQAARRIDTSFSPNTQTAAFRIPIPEDIVRKSPSIPDVWTEMFPPSVLNYIPDTMRSLSKNEIIAQIEAAVITNPVILQLFTVPIRVTAKMRGPGRLPHTIRSSHSIRYNRRLHSRGLAATPINRNPAVDSILVYKVKGDAIVFNSETGTAESVTRIDNSDDPVILIEPGYSYFIEAASQSRLDYTTTMFGTRMAEKHYAYWQFALDPRETAGVHHSKFMDFGSVMGGQWSIMPPTDKNITKFTFWVTVTDEAINERMRPEGSALVEVPGRFAYK
ncbi:MAG: hypothetical protein FWB85_11030 [Chitinispirillia bacterium]|nr:hypothetical protein [Chitinispirillia bacterium]MCL2242682.1 hypothetical protein [Chitinispirillia bacterium]